MLERDHYLQATNIEDAVMVIVFFSFAKFLQLNADEVAREPLVLDNNLW